MGDRAWRVSPESADDFLALLQAEARTFQERLCTDNGDWIVRGFIDVFRSVYTISGDTKVVSKLIELMLLPCFKDFAARNEYVFELARQQNHYPDMTFRSRDDVLFAVDLKSTYRTTDDRCNTMTLGAFSGYFRNRDTIKTTTYPYGAYSGHFVLGVVYDRAQIRADELTVHSVRELRNVPTDVSEALLDNIYTSETLKDIPAVVKNLQFFAQPKYRIAVDRPGSGNTKNIGSVARLDALLQGAGPFAALGENVFDDYWQRYMTRTDARSAGLTKPPYANLREYVTYRRLDGIAAEAIENAVKAADEAAEAIENEDEQ
ncbi:MAG TPA: type II restriction endonuclease [Chthonomonadaceae bacterium]|nr:type II restriction endonuclease [Chthonomonadaceae bacterium]